MRQELQSLLAPQLGGLSPAADLIERAIDPECPNVIRDGGVIAAKFDEELDRVQGGSFNSVVVFNPAGGGGPLEGC